MDRAEGKSARMDRGDSDGPSKPAALQSTTCKVAKTCWYRFSITFLVRTPASVSVQAPCEISASALRGFRSLRRSERASGDFGDICEFWPFGYSSEGPLQSQGKICKLISLMLNEAKGGG